MTHGDPAQGARHGDQGLSISRKGIGPIREFLDSATQGSNASPFFIWHAPFLPHAPHTPPKDLLAKYSKVAPSDSVARYWATCEWFDQTCAELLREVEERGLSDSTVVLYICDNGYIQEPTKRNMYAPRSKQSPYEGGVRTPIMIHWPKHVPSRIETGALASAIDLAPTILNLAGVTNPTPLPGIDLRDTNALRDRNTVYGSDHPHDIPNVNKPAEGFESRYLIEGSWKLIISNKADDNVELYQLEADPRETINLAAEHPALVARLTEKLNQWWSTPLPTATR